MTSTSPSSSDRPLAVALDLRLAGYRGGGIARYAVELHDALRDISGIAPRALCSRRDPAICPDDIALLGGSDPRDTTSSRP